VQALELVRDDGAGHYRAEVEGGTALLAFERRASGPDGTDGPGVLVLTHTEVPEVAQGAGVGGELVRLVLEDVRRRGEVVVPQCPFVARWLDSHPEHAVVVSPGRPSA
jgi:uncharacterized protein